MRTITDIYEYYNIMPNLQLHQLRVAGVAMQICESLNISVNKEEVITTCLLHDMGNIIKFTLEYFPEFLEPLGFEYWKKVQNDYKEKYGNNEHEATIVIAEELGTSERVIDLINCISFKKAPDNARIDDIARKVVAYADMRVMPDGVTSLAHRCEDLRARYQEKGSVNLDTRKLANDNGRISFEQSLIKIEKQIFAHTSLAPEDIIEESTLPYIEKLKTFSI